MFRNPKKFRRLVAGRCKYCSRQFFYRRDNRPKSFCNDGCRQADFRNARADFRHKSHNPSPRNESPQKSRAQSKVCKPNFADRPLNLVGGHKWSGRSIDRETLAAIIETEIGERRIPNPASAPSPHLEQIPADLSIPPFLKRAPS